MIIIWAILFILIIVISFVLAYRSMIDYQEIPQRQEENYGLYLVRASQGLTANVLDSVRSKLVSHMGVVSLERLFKDKRVALCIFGPKNILEDFAEELQLLELEDYTAGVTSGNMDIWEVGIKGSGMSLNIDNIFKNLPLLSGKDQFFWEVVMGNKTVQIRAAIFSESIERRKMFAGWFEDLAPGVFFKVPRPFSTEQMFDFFRLRSLGADSKNQDYGSLEIIRLLKI